MASVIADHTPQELAAELGALLRVDWRAVWPGIPADDAERGDWCARFGWQPLWPESGLWVRTRRGGRLHLAASGRPVTSASYAVWKVRAEPSVEGTGLMEVALDRYAACLDRMIPALGAPGWEGAWDRPDFPEPPAPGRWGDAEARLEQQAPYRLAQWSFANPLAPVIVLDLHCRAGLGAGGGTIALTFHGPADPDPVAGPGWLL
ncbi:MULTISPECIES: hypothetical protein [unclassified Streptomyces]|uniref:hypothetical protein n=1 Tax=unclassified Streptomyces TaxID=2593676 RepID=UPI002252AB00|nr:MULTISPECIES: hypothetical protein [unclassified Streptomyces]MCX4527022.1 hypothetical protein [Streptomyces sp. NBC_01551]MCX4542418.1 hypothetical protein [Streptomyces sp. NBC_01565]